MEESNRFQAIVAGKDSEIQNLGHQLAMLQQQQLPPPGVPQDVVTDLLQERDGALQDLQQELCTVHQERDVLSHEKDVLSQEKDVLSQDKNVLSFRVQELEQSLQQLQLHKAFLVEPVVPAPPVPVSLSREQWMAKYSLAPQQAPTITGGITTRAPGRDSSPGALSTTALALVPVTSATVPGPKAMISPPPGLGHTPSFPAQPALPPPAADVSMMGGKYRDVKVPRLPEFYNENEFLTKLGTNLVNASPHCDSKEIQWIREVNWKSFDELASHGDPRFGKLDNSLAANYPDVLQAAKNSNDQKYSVFAGIILRKLQDKQDEAAKANKHISGRQIVHLILSEFKTKSHMRESEFYKRIDLIRWRGDSDDQIREFHGMFKALMRDRPSGISDDVVRDALFHKMRNTNHGAILLAVNQFLLAQSKVEQGEKDDNFSLDFLERTLNNVVLLSENYMKQMVKSSYMGSWSAAEANNPMREVDNMVARRPAITDMASYAQGSHSGKPAMGLAQPGTWVPACPATMPPMSMAPMSGPFKHMYGAETSGIDKQKALSTCFMHQIHLKDNSKPSCKYGDKCKFSHDAALPAAEFRAIRKFLRQKDDKKEINMCGNFAKSGKCFYKQKHGRDCAFLHCDNTTHKALASDFGLSQ